MKLEGVGYYRYPERMRDGSSYPEVPRVSLPAKAELALIAAFDLIIPDAVRNFFFNTYRDDIPTSFESRMPKVLSLSSALLFSRVMSG
jgi:hypothetical protein